MEDTTPTTAPTIGEETQGAPATGAPTPEPTPEEAPAAPSTDAPAEGGNA